MTTESTPGKLETRIALPARYVPAFMASKAHAKAEKVLNGTITDTRWAGRLMIQALVARRNAATIKLTPTLDEDPARGLDLRYALPARFVADFLKGKAEAEKILKHKIQNCDFAGHLVIEALNPIIQKREAREAREATEIAD